MSRTTTVDGAPASDTDKQSISQPNQFIKRGTPQFMRVTLALFSAGPVSYTHLRAHETLSDRVCRVLLVKW
ncbi:hypothetical protein OQ616_25620, partial [Escherichia coli]|nr:hypothetical protein [Escherichia coli]